MMQSSVYRNLLNLLLVSLISFLMSCASTGDGHRSNNALLSTQYDPVIIPLAEELQIGLKSNQSQIEANQACASPELQDYVQKIGLKLAQYSDRRGIEYHFTVFDSDIINAWALPGGYIYITTGLMKMLTDEAQLAAVLGHEIGHVVRYHGIKHLQRGLLLNSILTWASSQAGGNAAANIGTKGANIGANLLMMRNSREDELEADEQGMKIASQAGYDPAAMFDVQALLLSIRKGGAPDLVSQMLATHPIGEDRESQVRELLPKYAGPTLRNENVYQSAIAAYEVIALQKKARVESENQKAIEAKAIEDAKPLIPVSVTVRAALLSNSQVSTFRNSGNTMVVGVATFSRPQPQLQRAYVIRLSPGQTLEIGSREGWAGQRGDLIVVSGEGYKSTNWRLP